MCVCWVCWVCWVCSNVAKQQQVSSSARVIKDKVLYLEALPKRVLLHLLADKVLHVLADLKPSSVHNNIRFGINRVGCVFCVFCVLCVFCHSHLGHKLSTGRNAVRIKDIVISNDLSNSEGTDGCG